MKKLFRKMFLLLTLTTTLMCAMAINASALASLDKANSTWEIIGNYEVEEVNIPIIERDGTWGSVIGVDQVVTKIYNVAPGTQIKFKNLNTVPGVTCNIAMRRNVLMDEGKYSMTVESGQTERMDLSGKYAFNKTYMLNAIGKDDMVTLFYNSDNYTSYFNMCINDRAYCIPNGGTKAVYIPKDNKHTMDPCNEATENDIYSFCTYYYTCDRDSFGNFTESDQKHTEWVFFRQSDKVAPNTNIDINKQVFNDVTKKDYCYDSVYWAFTNKVTHGTSAGYFSPNNTCTEAQILTMLNRFDTYHGTWVDLENTNIKYTDWYSAAYQAAIGRGMISGTNFKPNTPCTRASTVVFMWKMAGKPMVSTKSNFSDITPGTELANAVNWAVEKGITKGTTATTFSPDNTCTRGQIVTFMYRAL